MNIESFYRQFMSKSDIVFDCGANLGDRTAVFSRLVKEVVAIEPIAESAERILALELDNVSVVHAAMGKERGIGKIRTWSMVPHVGTASMSDEWIKRVEASNRFGERNFRWDDVREIQVDTLDDTIGWFGKPAFIKIDVEGYEYEVLQGLSEPVDALSFEYTPEYREAAENCILYLAKLGMVRFAWSEGESFRLSEWTSSLGLSRRLDKITGNEVYGDIYARRG